MKDDAGSFRQISLEFRASRLSLRIAIEQGVEKFKSNRTFEKFGPPSCLIEGARWVIDDYSLVAVVPSSSSSLSSSQPLLNVLIKGFLTSMGEDVGENSTELF